MAKPTDDPLDPYRKKRSADTTNEPFGGGSARPRLFVVQKHHARRLHFDFRLELNGTLKSWAVPNGPSFDPAVKRLAVHVEDHPVAYADFEGIIPDGNYGAGAVILWDRGRWVAIEDPERGLVDGKILFELHGYKLRGLWQLVRTKRKTKAGDKRAPEEWLLIKKPDGFATPGAERPVGQESILSGLAVDDLRAGAERARAMRATLDELAAPRHPVAAESVEVMLAEQTDAPFSRAGWIFEIKYDGYRAVAARENGKGRLLYRRGLDASASFPDVTRALRALPFEVVMDGEIVILDELGRPNFGRLQRRGLLVRPSEIERLAVELPATLFVFDLLAIEGYDLRALPLRARKEVLRRVVPRTGPLRFADDIDEHGEQLFAEVRRLGLEGMVGKRADSPYLGGRSSDWQKVRIDRTGDFVVVGYKPPQKRGRTGFSGLHLASSRGDGLRYVGSVGSGFSEAELVRIHALLAASRRDTPPCDGPLPTVGAPVWVEPQLVVEVRYKEITDDGLLRQPSFLRFRDDKKIEDCHAEGTPVADPAPPGAAAARAASAVVGERSEVGAAGFAEAPPPIDRRVPFSNLDKIFWPEEGYSKGDLIEFYRTVAPSLLPYLRDRPVVLTRYPDGVAGKSFFQKDAPEFVPGWVRTERIWSEHTSRDIDYFICDDVETLLYVINMGSIPLHVWASRVGTLELPDWTIIDLDPKGAPFTDVVKVARAVRALCDEIELPSFPKTSGASGLHVMIPLGGSCTFAQSRALAELLSRVITDELPEIATMNRSLSGREGRVYLDWLQNGHGKTIAGPFSARPVPGAGVSTPLKWSEVTAKLDPRRWNIKTVPARLNKLDRDPLRPVLDLKPDLAAVLTRLSGRVRR